MKIEGSVHQWPDYMSFPYGKKCRCGEIGTIVNSVCTECGAEYRSVKCKRCGQWYGKTHDQFGDGCPSCSGLIGYPAKFYETDEYKREQKEKATEKRNDAIRHILSERFTNVEALTVEDLVGIAIDLYRTEWRDELAHEWVEQLIAMVADPEFYIELEKRLK